MEQLLEYNEIKILFKFLGEVSPNDIAKKGLTPAENEILFHIYRKLYPMIVPEDLKEIIVDSMEELE